MMNKKWMVITISCVFITMGLWANLAHCAATITVDPARIEVMVKPGVNNTGAILVSNPGTDTVRLGAEVRDWNMNEKGDPIFAQPKDGKNSCASWIRFNPRIALLNPGKKQIVRYSIAPPKGTLSGEYRAAVLFSVESAESGQKKLSLSGNVATTIYANVAPIQRRGELLSSVASYQKGILTACSVIRSTGNAHLRFDGSFVIIDANGMEVGKGKYQGKAVFPGQERELIGEWKGQLKKGIYKIRSNFSFLPSLYAQNMGEYAEVQGLKSTLELNVD